MTHKRHALLLFTKAPLPGIVKTRLTQEFGGIFTPEEAADFYKHCLLDVTEIAFDAIAELSEASKKEAEAKGCEPDAWDVVISTSPESNLPHLQKLFEEYGPWPSEIKFIVDHGKTFDEHFDDAIGQVFEQGYESMVALGGDLPQCPVSHIVSAFQWLDYFSSYSETGAFVQAPCQECGVSVVGYTRSTPMDSTGVYYNVDGLTCLDAYTAKARERGIPVACLPQVADIDDAQDLAHATSLIHAVGYAGAHQPGLHVPRYTLWWLDAHGIVASAPPNENHDPRDQVDL
ncbi:MAG: DUF2064 domain-containing protein [Coriobacteriia bacterium]